MQFLTERFIQKLPSNCANGFSKPWVLYKYFYAVLFFPNRLMHLTTYFFFSELSFKRRLLLFLQEHQYYIPDFRFNITLVDLTEDETYDLYEQGNFKILATR